MFSLQPAAFATKAVIERARVEELEWALVNEGRGSVSEDDLDGIGALLLDDDSLGELALVRKTEESQEPNKASDVISASGVRYRHRNSDVVTSRVAGKVEKQFAERRKKSAAPEPSSRIPARPANWPPKRKKHANSLIKPIPDTQRILASRKRKLLVKGMIHDFHGDYRRFAVEFGNMRAEEQTRLLAMLDDEYPDGGDG